jgi:RNA polymerase sigma factor (sigma-70 family)
MRNRVWLVVNRPRARSARLRQATQLVGSAADTASPQHGTIEVSRWSRGMMVEPSSAEVEQVTPESQFTALMAVAGDPLRRALVAAYGIQVGNDVCADALAWAWEHQQEMNHVSHPVAYLFRVGQSSARRYHRWDREVRLPPELGLAEVARDGVGLDEALSALSRRQRAVVVLIHAHGWSYGEVADALGISVASVRNHAHRGMKQLRRRMETS